MRSWLHSPGITLAGRCRLRNGTIVFVKPSTLRGAIYSAPLPTGRPIFYDIEGNCLSFNDLHRDYDIVENLENLHRREQ